MKIFEARSENSAGEGYDYIAPLEKKCGEKLDKGALINQSVASTQ
jgi:hypothetical protein